MPVTRNVYRYHFKLGNKIVCTGLTHDIQLCERKRLSEPGWSKGHIFQVGPRVEYADALEWLREQKKKGKPIIESQLP